MVSLDDFAKILLTEEQIRQRVKELAQQVVEDYKGSSLIMLTVMKGADNFSRDLRKEMMNYSQSQYGQYVVDLIQDMAIISLYPHPDRKKDHPDKILGLSPEVPYKSNPVLIVEDIIDRGLTINFLKIEVLRREPKTVRLCSLLNKPDHREMDITIDYLGFQVPDEFVVGYGLDFEERYRDVPFIGVLKREIYEPQQK